MRQVVLGLDLGFYLLNLENEDQNWQFSFFFWCNKSRLSSIFLELLSLWPVDEQIAVLSAPVEEEGSDDGVEGEVAERLRILNDALVDAQRERC